MENEYSDKQLEQIFLYPWARKIKIFYAYPKRAYGLFDSETGIQVSDFVNTTDEKIEFKNINTDRDYDIGVIENMGKEKPKFSLWWDKGLRDDTYDDLMKAFDYGKLFAEFPYFYTAKNSTCSPFSVSDFTDENNNLIGRVTKLSGRKDKSRLTIVYSFKTKDDQNKKCQSER